VSTVPSFQDQKVLTDRGTDGNGYIGSGRDRDKEYIYLIVSTMLSSTCYLLVNLLTLIFEKIEGTISNGYRSFFSVLATLLCLLF